MRTPQERIPPQLPAARVDRYPYYYIHCQRYPALLSINSQKIRRVFNPNLSLLLSHSNFQFRIYRSDLYIMPSFPREPKLSFVKISRKFGQNACFSMHIHIHCNFLVFADFLVFCVISCKVYTYCIQVVTHRCRDIYSELLYLYITAALAVQVPNRSTMHTNAYIYTAPVTTSQKVWTITVFNTLFKSQYLT